MGKGSLPLCAVLVAMLIGLVPVSGGAQESSPSGLSGPTQSASDSSLTMADLQNRRQQIVVSSMKFSNDDQKKEFLKVYAPYQIKLRQILTGERQLIDDYAQKQQNGVISSADANRLMKQALALDARRQQAVASYCRELKSVLPEQRVLRAYQIENRIHALYMNQVTSEIPLVP